MTAGHVRASFRDEWPALPVPLLALLITLPLWLHGPSCGHDFGFHMQSWMDASQQMRHGVPLPHWAYSPAFNAGEPRFIFYPPLSWLLGSTLLLVLPSNIVPAAFTFVALTLAGWGMYALARRLTGSTGALLVAALYLANPYMLFTAFERTAYAELLAAAWMPWLLRAVFAARPNALAIGFPLALLWLTNAPAAVMGTYALAFLVLLLLVRRTPAHLAARTGWLGLDKALVTAGAGGLVLGLALAGFYLLPAAFERRYVQIAMAVIPNMRVEDNFLFGHTGYGPHDQVLHTASLVAVSVLLLTALALAAGWWRVRTSGRSASNRERALPLAALTLVIAALLFHATLPVWHLLPEMAFLQFPWRLLAVLACVYGAAVALALGTIRVPALVAVALSVALAGVSGPLAMKPFREGCEAHELPRDRMALFAAHHGVGPTDEYTPGEADNDQLRWDDPAWWLNPDPKAPGPNTVPNPAATIVNYDEPPPLDQTVSGQAPTHLHLDLEHPEALILNLRDYPAWTVAVNGRTPPHLERDDGLIAVALERGPNDIDVRWRTLPDAWLGDAVSLCAAGIATFLFFHSRKIRVQE